MIFFFLALLLGYYVLKQGKGQYLNFFGLIAVLMLFSIEFYLFQVGEDIKNFYAVQGLPGDGVLYRRCGEYDLNGTCINMISIQRFDRYDEKLGLYLAFRDAEKNLMQVFFLLIPFSVLGFLVTGGFEAVEKLRLWVK